MENIFQNWLIQAAACKLGLQLQEVHLIDGTFRFPTDIAVKVPLPTGLKLFRCMSGGGAWARNWESLYNNRSGRPTACPEDILTEEQIRDAITKHCPGVVVEIA